MSQTSGLLASPHILSSDFKKSSTLINGCFPVGEKEMRQSAGGLEVGLRLLSNSASARSQTI